MCITTTVIADCGISGDDATNTFAIIFTADAVALTFAASAAVTTATIVATLVNLTFARRTGVYVGRESAVILGVDALPLFATLYAPPRKVIRVPPKAQLQPQSRQAHRNR